MWQAEVDASWFLAWLMLEAFHNDCPVLDAELDLQAAEQATMRFGCCCFHIREKMGILLVLLII